MHVNARLILRDAECLRQRGFAVQAAADATSVVIGRISLPGPGWTDAQGKAITETA